ncbi:FecR family protein [Chitinophaga sp. 22321]|uniref:FecR domain-containing protein n=1 Tax=Chitinophaga hostae TaxID=2831022 RepID=A0ABS5IXC2_9BACT|nr:FecR family protein [Chitinophaga hostae]MBS0027618.1 FecR domain-containing protein [Chitinophaga hostae]
MSTSERLKYLSEQVRLLRATQEEYKELLQLISQDESGEVVRELDALHATETVAGAASGDYDHAYWQLAVKEVLDADKPVHQEPFSQPGKKRIHLLQRYWWAAAAVVFIATGIYYFAKPSPPPVIVAASPAIKDIAPGGNRAVLTLSDGSQIPLDSANNGVLAKQGNTSITKLSNGQLAYNESGSTGDKVLYNTMSTPSGGQYQLILPDGTGVWLNAASSIYYPTAFTGNERTVTITGEVYFEVAQNEKMPFRVKAGNTTVEVLGTHFNINAYKDEPSVNTTLLQGTVQINANQQKQVIKPGQQARVIASNHGIQVLDNVDLSQVMAWKKGFFSFNDADLPTVMRQLSRWYNVEVKYEGEIPQRLFTGEIGRDLTLSQVLKGLSKTRIRYKIENGNRIIIQP